MKGFIEVTEIGVGKTLIAVREIKFVRDDQTETFIAMKITPVIKKPWIASGFSVAETYSEVIEKIKAAE